MKIRAKTTPAILALLTAFWPGISAAQVAHSCGPTETLLMYCTVEGGARTLNLCRSGETITYAFGPTGGTPTLEMTRAFDNVSYTPSEDDDGTVRENVTLFNGNYGYEMFTASRIRTDPAALTEGGIIVLLPDGRTQTLRCDEGSVAPNDPLDGIGQLARLGEEVPDDPLGFCLSTRSPDAPASQCLGRLRDSIIVAGTCNPASHTTNCWQTEATAWDALMEAQLTETLTALSLVVNLQFMETFLVAQETWNTGRDLDCEINRRNPDAIDQGQAQCRAEYAARRIGFFESVLAGAEAGR